MRDPFQNDQTVSFVTIIWGHVRLTPSISYLFNWLLFRYSYYRKRHNDWPKVHARLKRTLPHCLNYQRNKCIQYGHPPWQRVAGKVDLLSNCSHFSQKTSIYLAIMQLGKLDNCQASLDEFFQFLSCQLQIQSRASSWFLTERKLWGMGNRQERHVQAFHGEHSLHILHGYIRLIIRYALEKSFFAERL